MLERASDPRSKSFGDKTCDYATEPTEHEPNDVLMPLSLAKRIKIELYFLHFGFPIQNQSPNEITNQIGMAPTVAIIAAGR
jgi:hypothetical protein